MGRRAIRLALACLAFVALGTAALQRGFAQPWSVQTVAFRDLREASAAVDQLRGLGLDAYTEFAMNQGRQYVRVRVGCTTTRDAAQRLADLLAGRITREAAVVPLTPGAPVSGCVAEDVGFLKPARWKQIAPGSAVFDVTIAGQSARLVYTGLRWAVVQDGAAMPSGVSTSAAAFAQANLAGAAVVRMNVPGDATVLCPGKLIAAVGATAVVERSREIVACSRRPVPPTLVGGAAP